MKLPKTLPSFVALFTLLVGIELSAQVVEQVTVIKSFASVQTSAAAPFIDPSPIGPNYGGPYNFSVDVSGTNLSGIPAPTVTLPAGSLFPTQNPVGHHGGVLVYNANEEHWAYGLNGNDYGGQSAADRDAAFAAGTYHLSVFGTVPFDLNFPTTSSLPNTPSVTLTGGTWVRGNYMIDLTQPLTITTNTFTNFDQNVDGVMTLSVDGITDQLVFRSANPTPNSLTYTIPANTLVAGTEYLGNVGFFAVMDRSTGSDGSLRVAAYGQDTHFRIVAYNGTLPSATLHGIGDLPGGIVSSEVRDVTRMNNVLYAVGSASANSGLPAGRDTAVIWTTTGGLTPLPNLVTNTVATSFVSASAITPNTAFIASRARSVAPGGAFQAVRVTTSSMTNLSFAGLAGGSNNSSAVAISGNGSVLYGNANNPGQAVRYTATGPTGTLIPFLNPGDNTSNTTGRGCSLDGVIMVGTSTNTNTGHRGAFRYVQGAGVTAIPYLSGGTWNYALAITPNGGLTLVFGDSPSAPQGEFYLHNATNGTVTPLGTPNGNRGSGGLGGMTADGSVVVGNLNNLVTVGGVTTGSSASYVHNSHGWHDLQAVAAASGVDLTGWTLDPVIGLSADGTMVWGNGTHNGHPEGFVLEFAPGFLAAYTEPATYSTPGQAIVGAWTVGDTTNPAGGAAVLIFYANGYYMHIEMPDEPDGAAPGFERGQYNWNANTGQLTFKTLLDTNGEIGLSGEDAGPGLNVTISGNTATAVTPDGNVVLTRVTGTSPLVGAFGSANIGEDSTAVVFLPNGYFYLARDGDSASDPDGHDGMEWGTYTWNPTTHAFAVNVLVDTNGDWGLNDSGGALTVAFSGDLVTLTFTSEDGDFPIPRVGGVSVPAVAGDFNGDGSADAAWTNPAAGQRAVWLMSDTTIIGGADLGLVDPVWRMAAAADFNGDGRADILWQNTSTGQRYIWFMNGSTFLGDANLGTVPVEWSIATAADFNGDGKPDILWQNTITGERALWFMNGSTHVGDAGLGVVPVEWSIATAADFNGDGKPDILWQNTITGERALWFMNGSTHVSDAGLGIVQLEWSIATAADFNGDAKPDILWQNTITGERALWFMNGSTHVSDAGLGIVPLEWSIATAADFNGDGKTDILWQRRAAVPTPSVVPDFNGDGKTDILWQNTTTGERYLWFMNGATYFGAASLGIVPLEKSIAAAADFNGDGKKDILWQNTITGERALWFMNGSTHVSDAGLGVVPLEWSIAAAADFNGDGKPDILWQNTITGERALWFMNGSTHVSDAGLGVVPLEWSIATAADFNGDGKPDILWQNTITGERALWFMNGSTHVSDAGLGIVPLEWSIATAADFNGDGKPDILWQNTITGERALWFMNGSSHVSNAGLGIVPLEWKIVR